MSKPSGIRGRWRTVPKTLGTLALLGAALPLNLALTGAALIHSAISPPPPPPPTAEPRTVLLSGGKMTKALQLARCFSAAGHRVILAESAKYRLTGHRFSRAVDRFHTLPPPHHPAYTDALVDIVRREGVDVYVPVCSPASSRYDALALPALSPYCEVLHGDEDTIDMLDDKSRFAERAVAAGLLVPDTHRVNSPREVEEFDFAARGVPYILKSIAYDPVNRLDLTPLPRPTPEQTAAFARSKPITADNPWILQALVSGREYCTHGTMRDGRVQVWCCCESSPSQLNYAAADKPEIEAWVTAFADALKLTGQFSFDFMETDDGELYAIECNPRTHSAITLFHNRPDLAYAYLDAEGPVVRPAVDARPTYWLYQEMWRALRHPSTSRQRLAVVRRGRDAIFDRHDPLPFLMVHHLQIPWLLAVNLLRLKPWVKIDFNIGKLVEPAGD
ncbi:hypothetical protein [Streptomyces sp. NPDC055056]